MLFEECPIFEEDWLVVPFSDVAGEYNSSSDDDEANVNKLGLSLGDVCGVGHVGIGRDGGEDIDDGPGMIVDRLNEFGLGGGERFWCDGSKSAVQVCKNFRNRADK